MFRTNIIRTAFTLVTVFALSAFAFGDTLRLKDGSIIKGKIVSFQDGKFTVAIGDGARKREMTFFATEILSIAFDQNATTARSTTSTVDYQPASNTVSTPVKQPVVVSTPVTTPKVQANTGSATLKPIQWTVSVLADNTANGWTNTGWVVKKGQRVRISGDGKVSLGGGKSSGPSGNADLNDDQKLLKNVPTGALIAVIGDDNNDFIYIGAEREIVASRDGALFLGINEGNLDDNKGAYSVKVEVVPDSAN